MVTFVLPFLVALATLDLKQLALARPPSLTPRIAQISADTTRSWENACRRHGGGSLRCRYISVQSFGSILFAAPPCAQQDAADNLVDFSKNLGNDTADMIRLAQLFVQQPRNTNDKLSVPYCQQPPRNVELQGLYQCQFNSTDPQTFVGGAKVGEPGTIPFGLSEPVDPPGSCLANPSGPIPDGVQLTSITQNPFAGDSPSSGDDSVVGASEVGVSGGGQEGQDDGVDDISSTPTDTDILTTSTTKAKAARPAAPTATQSATGHKRPLFGLPDLRHL